MKLIHGDCLKEMFDIPDNSVDMVCCDMPYGTTACKWDTVLPLDMLWHHYKRICKDSAAIVLFASQPFTTTLIASNMKMFKYCWVWVKHAPTNFATANRTPMKYHEDITVFYGKQPTYNKQMIPRTGSGGERTKYKTTRTMSSHIYVEKMDVKYDKDLKNPSTVLRFNGVYKNTILHPTQKPVALIEYLIKTYTNEGDTVLDHCMGSGTTGVACKNLNRDFIGIELDKKYLEIAKQRIEETQYNQSLNLTSRSKDDLSAS